MNSIKKTLIIPQLIVLFLALAMSAYAAGEVDSTFNGAAYANLTNQGSVNVIKFQPDGKILIGGQFTEVQGYAASGLARLNADGTVDKTFNAPDLSGVDSNTGVISVGGPVHSIAVQPDGKILVGGNLFLGTFGQSGNKLSIRRLNADGSIDSTFTTEQMAFGSAVYDIKLQSDGKILLGGLMAFTSSGNVAKSLARLNANGTLDTTFIVGSTNPIEVINDFEIQPDGKIVAGGFIRSETPNTATSLIRRFNTDGSADSSYSVINSGNGAIEALELLADGKILIAGNYTTLNSIAQGRVSRLNADGSIDTTFNSTNSGANALVKDIAVRADGKIIIGGEFSTFNGTAMQRIARLNADGSLDNTFTNSATITNTVVNDVELLPDNRILAGSTTSTLINPLLRFSSDGVFDSSFVVRANRAGTVRKILQQPDGKILIAGEFLYVNGVERRSMARLNADGSLDNSFVPYFTNNSPLPLIQAIALQPDGKIIVGAWHGVVLQRLNTDGSQDTSFVSPLTSSSQVYDVLVQADGKILVGGNMVFALPKVARFNADGSRDMTFNLPQPDGLVYKILTQPNGKILIGGVFTTISDIGIRRGIARYNVDGGLDNTFIPPNPNIAVYNMELQTDGKIVIVGNGARRLNSDGTLDNSLNLSANSQVNAVKIQPDGRILVGGGFSLIGGIARNGIARFKATGALDTGFLTFSNRDVWDIQMQTDGKILVGGGFSKINGVSSVRVARLLNVSVPDRTLFDYDGDGKADVSVFRPSENRWYIFRSSDGVITQTAFAITDDKPVPADFDGDGKTDIAIFRASGDWWSLSSSNNAQVTTNLGNTSDIKLPSDFDGDGRADYIIFRPSNNTWYRLSSGTGMSSNVIFGLAGDKPVSGDFDGDGKSDVAIYRPSTGDWWYQSSSIGAQLATRWGIASDIPVPADYDGDGKTDFAVYRPSTGVWYIYNSSTGNATIMAFGLAEDKPIAADYDGDGKADIAVFRPSTGIWYMMRSTAGFTATQFGISSDIPTPNAFIP